MSSPPTTRLCQLVNVVAGRRTICGGEAVARVARDGITYLDACRRHTTKARNDGWWVTRATFPQRGGHL